MSLQQILNRKNKFADDLLDKFDRLFAKLTPQSQKALVTAFKAGDFSKDTLSAAFVDFDDLTTATVSQFSKVARFSKQISDELGYKFLLTEDNRALFNQLNDLNIDRLFGVRDSIVKDLRSFAIQSKLEGKSVRQIRAGLEDSFKNMGRRLNAEIYTGLSTFESAVDMTSMLNGGITRFVYMGPFDSVTRDICQNVLSDPRQSTGWTLSEIEESGAPFIERGGWNCRHRWMAFTGLIEEISNKDKSLLKSYTEEGYIKINNELRSGRSNQSAENLSMALNKLPKYDGKVFRGMSFGSKKEYDTFLNGIKENGIFTDKGFLSSTIDSDVGLEFAQRGKNRILYNIKSKTGRVVDKYSTKPFEKEVVFDRKTKFGIGKIEKINIEGFDHTIINLVEL